MTFQITALPAEPFAPLFTLTDAELAELAVFRRTADAKPGFPCRVSLEDADPGDTVLLLNHEHLPAASPYRARHAIYVRQGVTQARPAPGEIPEMLRRRPLSLRAYDVRAMMLGADLAEGFALEAAVARLLALPGVSFLHLHNAKPGCYAARLDPVQPHA